MDAEQKQVVGLFKNVLKIFDKRKIIIYGTGRNTEAILDTYASSDIAGLMDAKLTGQTVFGLPVLSDAEVIALKDPIVVIVARDSVVNIIYKRIEYLYDEYGIEIYDYKGEPCFGKTHGYQNEGLDIWNRNYEELLERIKASDVVSFDIFDTLIMRKTLLPADVFELVERRLAAEGKAACFPGGTDFKTARIKAEKEASPAPDINKIYEKLCGIYGLTAEDGEYIKKLEQDTDRSLFLKRETMCSALSEAVRLGKDVYILSDMYYTPSYLKEVLNGFGINGYKDLIVSCDKGTTKETGGLYRLYKELACNGSEKKLLHIGDNRIADGEKAEENGISTYILPNAYGMLEQSDLQDALSDVSSLSKRLCLGLVISHIFNDPFKFSGTKGHYRICDDGHLKEAGYFIAPMMFDFVIGMGQKVRSSDVKQIIFGSRDGWLVKRLYDALVKKDEKTFYIRTSRRAAVVAALRTEEDVYGALKRKFNGTLSELLEKRLGIHGDSGDPGLETRCETANHEELCDAVRPYISAILANAAAERERYIEYLKSSGIYLREKAIFFDLLAGGTVQYNLEKVLGTEMEGYYFGTMNLPNDMFPADTEKITGRYGNITSYGNTSAFSKHYLLLEAVLTDGYPSFIKIGEDGREVFAKENDTPYGIIKPVHDEIACMCDELNGFESIFTDSDPIPADEIFGLLFLNECICGKAADSLLNDDSFDGTGTYRVKA